MESKNGTKTPCDARTSLSVWNETPKGPGLLNQTSQSTMFHMDQTGMRPACEQGLFPCHISAFQPRPYLAIEGTDAFYQILFFCGELATWISSTTFAAGTLTPTS